MKTPHSRAPLFAAIIAAIGLLSATTLVSATPIAPQEKYQFTPMLEDDGAAVTTGHETAAMHAALQADAQRKRDAARAASAIASIPVPTMGEGGTGAECRIPSSNAAGHVCRAPSSAVAGTGGSAHYGPGSRHGVGRKTYMLPLEDLEFPGR